MDHNKTDQMYGVMGKALAPALILLLAVGCAPPDDPMAVAGQALSGGKKVAAVQYASGGHAAVDSACSSSSLPDACAVGKLVAQAQSKGAVLVVTPEYGLGQKYYEPVPTLGENPGTSSSWTDDTLIKGFSKQAAKLAIHIVIDLQTTEGQGKPKYNTLVAFDSKGKVVGVHHKFELFSSESKNLTPGKGVMVFDSPVGKVGLLICADIYGASPLHNKLVKTLKARVIAFSAHWMTAGAPSYPATFAKTHGVYFIAANTTLGPGQGGGVYDPNGKTLAQSTKNTPSIIYATIPSP